MNVIDLSFVTKFGFNVVDLVETSLNYVAKKGFNGFVQFKLTQGTVNVYESGRILFQFDVDSDFLMQLLNNMNLESKISLKFPIIGTDEAGKGEKQGALVTAGVMVTSWEQVKKLISLGVSDSKRLKINKITKIATKIKKISTIKDCDNPLIFDIVKISPDKFNKLWHEFGNVNKLLGWSHAKVILNLIQKAGNINKEIIKQGVNVYVDRFSSIDFRLSRFLTDFKGDLTVEPKAEIYPWVATAAILAKDSYQKSLDDYATQKDYR